MRASAVFTFINIFYHMNIGLTENHKNYILVTFSSILNSNFLFFFYYSCTITIIYSVPIPQIRYLALGYHERHNHFLSSALEGNTLIICSANFFK